MMFQRYRHIAQVVAATVAISATCVVVGQQVAPPRQPAPPRAVPQPQPAPESRDRLRETSGRVDTRVQATVIQRSSLLIGAPVHLAGNVRFGTVREFVISEQGCVDYLIVDYQGRFAPIPWSVMTFNPDQRVVILDIPQTQIARIPTFTQFNQFTQPAFVEQINTFFNIDVDVRSRTRDRDADDRRRDGDRPRDADRPRDGDRPRDTDPARPRDDADRPKADRPDSKPAPKAEPKPAPEKPKAEPKPEPKAEPKGEESPPPKKTPEEQP